MAKKKKTSYEEWLKQNDSGVVRTADAVVTTMRGIQNTVQNATQRSRLNKYNTPGFNPYENYSTAVQYGKDLQSMYDSYKGRNLFVNSLKAGQNPLDAYRQESLLKNAITRHNTYMDGIADEAAFNEQIAYPMRYQGLTSAAGVNARLKGMQQTINGLRQSGQTEKANALQAEYDWLSQRQYDYWRPEDFDAKVKELTGLADQARINSVTHGNYEQTTTGLRRIQRSGTIYDTAIPTLAEKREQGDLDTEKQLRGQVSMLQAAKERNAYRDVFSNLSAEERNRVSDAAKTIARYGGWDYARRENLDSYKNAVKSLQNKGYSIEEADAIIRYATLDTTARNRADLLKGVSDWAGQNIFTKAVGSIASIPMSIQGGVGYLGMLADKFTSIGQTDPFTGYGFRVDTNSAATAMSDLSQALRGAASKDMSGVGSLVYNATMSFADSMLAMATGEWAGEAALGLSAATQATKDAYARGATDTQALVMGGMAGLAESLFEHISIDKLRIMRTSSAASRKTIREFALDWVKQSFTEASEEGATDIANLISDAIIMGDKSELNTMIKQYQDSGMSESDATVQAWKDWGSQLFQDMAAGFLSGGMGTVVNTGIGAWDRNAGYVSEGRKILDAGNASALKELGAALPEGSYGRGLAEKVNADGTNKKTARQLGAIASELNQNTLRQGVQSRLEQLGVANASETATAIMRELNGQTTTKAQDQLLKSKAAQRVLTEFRSAAEGSTSYTNEWAYDALYENAERGRNLRTSDEAVKEVAEFAKDYGRHEEAVNKLFKLQSDMPVDSFKTGFDAAYTMGKNGVDMEQAMTATATQRMSETQRALAWEIGRSAANNTTTEEGAEINGTEGSVSVPGGGERYDGARAEESVGKLAEGAEPAKGDGQVLSRSAKDSGAADLAYEVNPVSTADFGIAGGTQNKSIYRVSENQKLTPAVQAAVDTAKANGRNIVLFGGGNLEVRDGDAIASVRGIYDSNTNTMYVRVDHERYTAEQIAKHENGHGLIAEGKVTVKEVQDYMKRTMDEEAVDQALADYADAYDGINISDKELWEEIVCDALGSMNIFGGITGFSDYAERAEQRGEAIRNAATEMQKGRAPPANVSEETQEILNSAGVQLDEGNDSASPSSFSRETWNESEYVQNREQAAQELSKALGISIAKAKKYISDVNSIAKMIADDRARLDYESSPGRSSFVGNTEYGGSIDFSTVCKKRRLYTGTIEAIQRAFPDRALTADELLKIRSYMADRGYEVNCGFCYVEGSRAKMGKYTKQFLDEYRQSGAEYVPTMAEMNTATGQEQIRREHPEVYDAYVKFMNKLAQRKPKLFQLATAYKGEILQKFKRGESVEEKNRNGGLRLQSFSDFEIIHLIDTMQVIMDMSRVGLAGQAYTKVPDFAWAFGRTGLKINLSLVAKGVDENGRLVYDDVEGMDHNEAKKLRDAYSKNVGTILVVFDDAQLKAAMADDFVDFIIPFHRSQWSKKDYAKMGLAPTTKDYTSKQNERYIKPVYGTKKDGSPKKLRAENFMPNTYWEYEHDGKWNAEKYLRMCAEANKRPKFANLLVDNKDGSFSLQPDGSTDGYWKLLIDFKMYDNKGRGSEQMPVRPDFNMKQARRMLNEYTGGHQSFPVAQDVVDHFKEELGGKKQSFSRELSALDSDYMTAVENGDMETAQRMVDEAAKRAGYTVKGWHGTGNKPFSKFNYGRSGIYITTAEDVAKTYGGNVMPLYGTENNQLVIDADGHAHFDIPVPEWLRDEVDKYPLMRGKSDTDTLAKVARNLGYSSLRINNIDDSESLASGVHKLADDVVYFESLDNINFKNSQVKSADPITYDDNGNVIPLSERFNPENADIRFSRDIENLDELREENNRLKKRLNEMRRGNENLQNRLDAAKQQTKRTTEPTLREGDVRKAARGLLKEMDSTLTVDDVADDMKALGEYMMRGESKRERAPSWEEVKRRASEIAERIVDNASALSEASDVELYKELRKYLRTTKLTLAETDRADMQDGYAEFVKRNFNSIKLGNEGLPVDSAYQELQEMYGKGLFPDDITHPADQLMHIEDVLNGLRPVYENPHSYHRQEAVAWAANAVIDTLLSEDVRQTAPTFADKAEARREKDVAEAVAWERYKGEQREDRLKERYAKRMKDALQKAKERRARDIDRLVLKQKFKESARKERSARTALWNKILDLKKDFRRMVEKPQQADSKHAPLRLARALDGVTNCFSVENRERILPISELDRALGKLRDVYKLAEKDDELALYYDEGLIDNIDAVRTMLNEVDPFDATLDSQKLQKVYDLLKMCKHNVTTANQFVSRNWAKTIIEAGRKWAAEIASASIIFKKGFSAQLLNYQLRPDSMFSRFSGFAKNSVGEQIQEMFVDGEEKMLRIQQDFYYAFERFSKSKEFDKLTRHGKASLLDVGLKDENGNAIKLTRDQMLALYMNLRSEDNILALAYGGADIPSVSTYYTGKVAKSFDDSVRTVSIDANVFKLIDEARNLADEAQGENVTDERRQEIQQRLDELQSEVKALEQEAFTNLFGVKAKIEKQLTKFEKDLVEAADEWMMKSKDYINAETKAMYGIEKAQVEHYWPIHRNMNFVNTDMRTAVNEINLENWGSLKERVKSHAPIKLTGFIFELDNHTKKMSQFCGFAAAQRDFNKLYQTRMPYQHSTLKEQIAKKFGSDSGLIGVSGMEYIDNYIAAVSGGGDATKPSVLAWARRNLPRATLSANIRVALSQVASVPTAAAEVGWGAMAKGFARYSLKGFSGKQIEALAKADPWFWQRSRGDGGMREFAEMKESTFALDRGYNKIAGTKVGKALLNWCQKFDMYATYTQWAMAEEWVKQNRKDLKKGSEAFDEAVSRKYRDILRRTQPNYTVTERSDLLRDKRESMKWATMYKTQSNQNLNILYDATAQLRQYTRDFKNGKNGVTQQDVADARRQFARAYSGVILGGTVTFVLFRAFANALIHAMNAYRDDDDKELTLESFLEGLGEETLGAMSGMFLLGSEIEEFVFAAVTHGKYWGLSDSAVSAISDVVKNLYNLTQDPSEEKILKFVNSLAAPLGLPISNVKKIVDGIGYHIEDIRNGEFLSFDAGVNRTAQQQASRFAKAMEDGDTAKMKRIYDEMVATSKAKDPEANTQKALREQIMDAYIGTDGKATLSESEALKLLERFGGKTGDEAKDILNKWKFEKEFGYEYKELDDRYIDGELSDSEYKNALMNYGGKSKEDADEIVGKKKLVREYGFEYSEDNIVDAAIAGDITTEEAFDIWTNYGGVNEREAENRATRLQFVVDNPGIAYDDAKIGMVTDYDEYVVAAKGANIKPLSAEDFSEYWLAADALSSDYDANGNPIKGSERKDKVFAYIASLDIPAEQKTAIALSMYAAKTVSKMKTW